MLVAFISVVKINVQYGLHACSEAETQVSFGTR